MVYAGIGFDSAINNSLGMLKSRRELFRGLVSSFWDGEVYQTH